MSCNINCTHPITFPVLTVTGTTGAAGAAGAAGATIIFDNTPAIAVATTTSSWEAFTGMKMNPVTSLVSDGDKLEIDATFEASGSAPPTEVTRSVRIQVSSLVIGDDSNYLFNFDTGILICDYKIILTRQSATHLYVKASVKSGTALSVSETIFNEIIAVGDTTNLTNVQAMGDGYVIGDITCKQFTIKYLKKS